MASVEFQLSTYMRARLETWETDTSIANNTSIVHARIKVWRTNSWSGQTYSSSVTRKIQIGSQVVCDWAGEINHYASYGEIEVASGQRTVTHNSDGARTITVQAWLTDNAGSLFTGSGSLDMTLGTIPRGSSGTFSKSTYTIGEEIKINFDRKSSSFTHAGYIQYPDRSGWVWAGEKYFSGAGTSWSWTPTQAEKEMLYGRVPNAQSATMWADCKTMNGSTEINQFSVGAATMKVNPDECRPLFSDFTFADANSTTTAITGNNQVMISGKSTLAVTISAANAATARLSATMTKYTFQAAGLTAEEAYTTSSITKTLGSPTVDASETPSATRDLVVTALDSRSISTAVTKQITIVPYSSPKISATATRVNGFENSTTVNISGSFSRIEVGGTAKNTVNTSNGVQYRYRQQGSSTWGSWTNRAATIDAATGKVTTAAFTLNLDNQAAFEFEFRITDKLETTTVSLTVPVGQPAFYIGTDGRISVGAMPTISKLTGEHGLLEVAGRAFANGNQLLEDKAGVIKKTNMASKSVGISAIDHAEQATLVYMGLAGFNRRTYSNGYLVMENLKTFIEGAGVNVAISSDTINLIITLPTTGSYVAEVYGQLWTNNNPQDYLLFMAKKNMVSFARAMAPKPNGAWAFVELTHPVEIANGDTLQWYLNTNGSNFSDGNMQVADSYTYLKIYKVAD